MSIQTLRECFALFDRDGDGFIPTREIALAIRATGINPTEKEMEKLLAGKEDFMFNFDTYAGIVAPLLQGRNIEADLIAAFKPFDRDGSGTISSSELKHVMLNLGEMPGDYVDEMINEADPSGSGKIRYDELVRLLLG